MGQPLRTTNQPEPRIETPAEPSSSKESTRTTPTLVAVTPAGAEAEPSIVRTYKRRLVSMVHPLQVRMLIQVIVYSLIIFVLLAVPVFKPLMQALDNPALSPDSEWHVSRTVENGQRQSYLRLVAGGGNGGGNGGGGGNGNGGGGGGPNSGQGGARKDRHLHPISSDFDIYSMGKDRDSVKPLTAQKSHDDVIRASDGGYYGLARNF